MILKLTKWMDEDATVLFPSLTWEWDVTHTHTHTHTKESYVAVLFGSLTRMLKISSVIDAVHAHKTYKMSRAMYVIGTVQITQQRHDQTLHRHIYYILHTSCTQGQLLYIMCLYYLRLTLVLLRISLCTAVLPANFSQRGSIKGTSRS